MAVLVSTCKDLLLGQGGLVVLGGASWRTETGLPAQFCFETGRILIV